PRCWSENLVERALVAWIHVLDEDKRYAGVGRQFSQKFLESIQPARGRTDSRYRKRLTGRPVGGTRFCAVDNVRVGLCRCRRSALALPRSFGGRSSSFWSHQSPCRFLSYTSIRPTYY